MTRLDPFTHAFAGLAEERFPDIRAEAATSHKETADLPQFVAMRTVQRVLADLESPEVFESEPEAAAGYLAAMFAAYRFWDGGRRLYSVSRAQIEEALAGAIDPVPMPVPAGACYLQLPEQWFWSQTDVDRPHEPVDGLFVIEGAHQREVLVLIVLGLRADRPGFSQIVVTASPHILQRAADEARVPFFASTLDGGEAAGLKSLVTEADVLLLAQVALQLVSAES